MYSLIIIDDEMFSLNTFKRLLDYKNFGFELKAAFLNPQEAMDYIKSNQIDVIVTDIKMPVISGIDIARYCFFNSPETKVIFLSGYKDFEYAQQGIKYNVHAYITKPVTSSVLAQTFSELYTILNNGKSHNQFLSDSANDTIRNCFMKIVLSSTDNITEDIKSLQEIGFNISTDSSIFAALSFSISNAVNYYNNIWKHGREQLVKALERLVNKEHQCGYSGLTFFHDTGFDIFFISKPEISQDNFKNFLDTYIVSVRQIFLECLKIETTIQDIFISDNVTDFGKYYETLNNKKVFVSTNNKQKIMLNAKKYIDEHFHENIALADVAFFSGFNQKYFSKLFLEYFKISFSDYLQKIRLETAKKLMTDTNTKITSIPNMIGLSSFSTFSKSFKKYTGYSPSEYKENFRKM